MLAVSNSDKHSAIQSIQFFNWDENLEATV